MKINKVWSIYFSGTGTTEKTVKTIADEAAKALGAGRENFDFTPLAARKSFPEIGADDLVIFGTPVIAGRVPNLLLKYLATIQGNGALAVPISLFGNRNFDNALIELRDILENAGFHTIAGGAFVGEHSFSTVLGAGRPDDRDIAIMKDFAAKIAAKAEGLAAAPAEPIEVEGIPETYGGYYQPRDRKGTPIDIRKVKPKTNDKCIKCGLCVKLCPLGSINPENPAEITGICMKCCACTKKCPVGAKYYDDEGYLYHQHELEAMYERRAEPSLFI